MSRLLLWCILIAFPVVTMSAAHKHVKHKHWTKKYDHHFKKNSKHYFGPNIDWHLFKAQAIAESSLNSKAHSKAGAKGIMQIMPRTYKEIKKKQAHFGNINEPRWNIAAAIYYNRQLYKRWKKKDIPLKERMNFTFASYNAGFNRVLKARKKLVTQNKEHPDAIKIWKKVSPLTPPETRHYIRRINHLMQVKAPD